MSERRLFVLLIGINEYAGGVSNLRGCINDINAVKAFVEKKYSKLKPKFKVLENEEATRNNVIKAFGDHFTEVTANDSVLIHYSGHGSRQPSAPEFLGESADGKDETWVLYDSRIEGGRDLADKELAALLHQIGGENAPFKEKKPHIVVSADCCHSGSGTRDAGDLLGLLSRQVDDRKDRSAGKDYLGGYYEKNGYAVPHTEHILIAACSKLETAKEQSDNTGFYTSILLETLEKDSNINYADLFLRMRARVKKFSYEQTPQLEYYLNASAFSQFISGDPLGKRSRYTVKKSRGSWFVEFGAVYGLTKDPDKITLEIFREGEDTPLTTARLTSIGMVESEIVPHEDLAAGIYEGRFTVPPVLPLNIYIDRQEYGDLGEELARLKEEAPEEFETFYFVDEADSASYYLIEDDDHFRLKASESDLLIVASRKGKDDALKQMFAHINPIAVWHNIASLTNPRSKIQPGQTELRFIAGDDVFAEEDVTILGKEQALRISATDEIKTVSRQASYELSSKVKQTLYYTLLWLSDDYSISKKEFGEIAEGQKKEIFDNTVGFVDEPGVNESIDICKVIISTEPLDDFAFEQAGIPKGQIAGTRASFVTPTNLIFRDWTTHTLRIRTVRQHGSVGEEELALSDGQIVIKPHSHFRAISALGIGMRFPDRGQNSSHAAMMLEDDRMQLLDFGMRARGEQEGARQAAIDLSNLQGADQVSESNPLKVEVRVDTGEDGLIMPVAIDEEIVIPLGLPVEKKGKESAELEIDHIPQISSGERSIVSALQMYVLKLLPGKAQIRTLAWMDSGGYFHDDFERIKKTVAEAKNVLLVIHGIIGDARSQAKDLRDLRTPGKETIYDKFDLILTYDYENLDTPIEVTARHLKKTLQEAGFKDGGDQRLTILAHSMGGLVCRWMIEREGGEGLVDHLIMSGVPNRGSVFGEVEHARRALLAMMAYMLNAAKPLLPYLLPLAGVIKGSKAITKTLEQMKHDSDFLGELNSSTPSSVRYTLIAGDLDLYQESAKEGYFSKMWEKILLFAGDLVHFSRPNDMAVSVKSILTVPANEIPDSEKYRIAAHHMVYYQAKAGLQTVAKVLWDE